MAKFLNEKGATALEMMVTLGGMVLLAVIVMVVLVGAVESADEAKGLDPEAALNFVQGMDDVVREMGAEPTPDTDALNAEILRCEAEDGFSAKVECFAGMDAASKVEVSFSEALDELQSSYVELCSAFAGDDLDLCVSQVEDAVQAAR